MHCRPVGDGRERADLPQITKNGTEDDPAVEIKQGSVRRCSRGHG